MDEKLTADAIKEKFKNRNSSVSSEKQGSEDEKVGTILEKAKEREKIYTEVGQERETQYKKEKEKHSQSKVQYRQTTIRILLKDLARLKKLESRFLSENSILTYEKVFIAGLDKIEKMNDKELQEYIDKSKKE